MAPPCLGNKINIVFVGKISLEKGILVFLQAFARVIERLPEYDLMATVVGTGELMDQTQALVKGLNITELVSFLGYIDDQRQLGEIYSLADIVIVPSIAPEGVPRIIDEALVHGAIVLASSIGGIPDEFTDEIMMVPPGDVDALVVSIEKVIRDAQFRSSLLDASSVYGDSIQRKPQPSAQHSVFILETLARKTYIEGV